MAPQNDKGAKKKGQETHGGMDHRHLNHEVPELEGKIPTTENVAATIWNLLAPKITKGKLHRVRLYENPDLFVDCFGDGR